MAVRDDSPGLNFEGVDVELGEPASGSPGAPMDSERGHARTETCTALPNPRTSASVPKSILPRKAPTKRNQRVLMHNCLTEVLSGGAEWDPHTVKTIEGKRIFASVSHPERTVAHIVAALDKVEILVDYSVLTRRFLLLCLADARKVIEIEVEQSRYAAGIPPGSRKKESEVLDIMVKQAFPATVQDWGCLAIPTWRTKYDHERNSIKNRLHAAKNWKVANDRFGSGVITLFPAKSCRFVNPREIPILRMTQIVLSSWTKNIARSFSLNSRLWAMGDSFGSPGNGNRTSGNVCRSEIFSIRRARLWALAMFCGSNRFAISLHVVVVSLQQPRSLSWIRRKDAPFQENEALNHQKLGMRSAATRQEYRG